MQFKSLALTLLLAASGASFAQNVQVTDAWVRATVPGQRATGAFMTLTAPDGAQLVGAASPVAGVSEVHEMKMEGSVMRMRAVPALDLPAGQAVALKPGGYHVMLMDLKGSLAAGSTTPLTLTFRDAKGATSRQTLQLPVQSVAPAGTPMPAAHGGHGAMRH